MEIIATVQKWGNTRAVRLPKNLAQQAGLEFGTQVSVTSSKAGILLKPLYSAKRYKLSDLLSRCKGKNPHRELIRGRRGKEVF